MAPVYVSRGGADWRSATTGEGTTLTARIWAVGDSLTFGVGWPGSTPGGWRGFLADALARTADASEPGTARTRAGSDSPQVSWVGTSGANPPVGRPGDRHDGHPGWRVDQLDAALDGPAIEGPGNWCVGADAVQADVVVLQAGSNDLIERRMPGHPGVYDEFDAEQRAAFAAELLERLGRLVRRVAAFQPNARLLLWTLPPMGRGGVFYASPSIGAVNALLPALVAGLKTDGVPVELVDVHAALVVGGETPPGLLGDDGVHLTPDGYCRVAAALLDPVTRTLAGTGA